MEKRYDGGITTYGAMLQIVSYMPWIKDLINIEKFDNNYPGNERSAIDAFDGLFDNNGNIVWSLRSYKGECIIFCFVYPIPILVFYTSDPVIGSMSSDKLANVLDVNSLNTDVYLYGNARTFAVWGENLDTNEYYKDTVKDNVAFDSVVWLQHIWHDLHRYSDMFKL